MLIAVVSDTHRNKSSILKIRDEIKRRNTDVIIHLGDNVDDIDDIKSGLNCECYNVAGNCDLCDAPDELLISIENKKIFMTHGHKYGVKFSLSNIFYRGKELGADIVLFGHTHVKLNFEEEGMWVINPGSPSLPKDGVASIAFIEIKNNHIVHSTFAINSTNS